MRITPRKVVNFVVGIIVTSGATSFQGIAVEWDGGGDGMFWHDDNNWDPDGVPGLPDDVEIENSDVFVTSLAEVRSVTETGGTLHVQASLDLFAASQIEALQLKGTIVNSDPLTLTGIGRWLDGIFRGGGNVTNTGELTVTSGGVRLIQNKTFTNSSVMTVEKQIDLDNAHFVNAGNLDLSGSFNPRGSSMRSVTNSGTFSTTSAAAQVNVPFVNQAGNIQVSGFDGPNPANLTFSSDVDLAGGVLSVENNAVITLQGTNQSLSAAVTAQGPGRVHLKNPLTLDATLQASLQLPDALGEGLIVEADVSGGGTLVNQGTVTWSGRKLSNTGGIVNQSIFDLKGSPKTLATTFRNERNVTHINSSLTLETDATFVNESRYTIESGHPGAGPAILGAGTFINKSQFTKSGAGEVTIGAPFQLSGNATVKVDNGELTFLGSGMSTTASGEEASFITSPSTKIKFNGGRPKFKGNYVAFGEGELEVSGPVEFVVEEDSLFAVNLENVNGWTINGRMELAGVAQNDGMARWAGNTIETMASGNFFNQGTLILDGLTSRSLSGQLINDATVKQNKNLLLETGMAVNGGIWELTNGQITSNGFGSFSNQNLLQLGAANVDSRISATFDMVDGKIEMQATSGPHTSMLQLLGGGAFSGNNLFDLGMASKLKFSSASGQKTFSVATGKTRAEGGGVIDLAAGASLKVDSGAEFLSDLSAGAGFHITGGTIGGAGIFRNTDSMRWDSGEVSISGPGPSPSALANEGFLLIIGPNEKKLSGLLLNDGPDRDVDNVGVVQQAGPLTLSGGTAINNGLWQVVGNAALSSTDPAARFINVDRFLAFAFSEASATVVVSLRFDNSGSVVVSNSLGGGITLRFTGPLEQFDPVSKTLAGGTWIAKDNGAVLDLPIPNEAWTIDGADVEGNPSTIPALRYLNHVSAGRVKFTGRTVLAGPLRNSGTLQVGGSTAPSKVTAPGGVTNEKDGKTDFLPGLDDPDDDPGQNEGTAQGQALFDEGFDVGDAGFLNHGTVRPGGPDVTGFFPIVGDFVQTGTGVLEIELGGINVGEQYDQLAVTDDITLEGTLDLSLIESDGVLFEPSLNDTFQIVTAGGSRSGTFDTKLLPTLNAPLDWNVIYGANRVTLSVISVQPGDYNGNGNVDSADYTVWRDTFGQSVTPGTLADGDGDGTITQLDYEEWKQNFGSVAVPGGANTAVPEPATWLFLFGAVAASVLSRMPDPLSNRSGVVKICAPYGTAPLQTTRKSTPW